MKRSTLQWSLVAILVSMALYLGSVVGTAQTESKGQAEAQKLDQVIQKLDELNKKLDELSSKMDSIQKDVAFIKARGKS